MKAPDCDILNNIAFQEIEIEELQFDLQELEFEEFHLDLPELEFEELPTATMPE